MDTKTSTNCPNSSQPWISETIARKTWCQKIWRNPTFCPLFTASHYDNLENPSSTLETKLAPRRLTHLSGRFTSHNLHKKFLRLMQFLPKSLQHTQEKKEQDEIIRGKFKQKGWSKLYTYGYVCKRVRFPCICTTLSWQNNQLFYKLFTGATEGGMSMGGSNFGDILPVSVPKCHGGIVFGFDLKTFEFVYFLLSGAQSSLFH